MKEPVFIGAATAVVTPYHNNEIDFAAYDRLLDTQLSAGIAAIVVCGTTGEASTLRLEEKAAMYRHTVTYVGGRCKVIAGVGSNNTAASVVAAKTAQDCGVDGLLAVTPYYNKCSQDGLVAHYYSIADATPLPLITYNVPSRTGVNLLPETCLKLSKHPNINGVKEAGGSIAQAARIISLCKEELNLWSGNDDQIVATMAIGGKGVISVLSNVRPSAVVRMAEACQHSDYKAAAQLQIAYMPLIDALFSDVNPIPVKAALQAMGICSDEVRLPLTPMSVEKRTKLHSALLTCTL